MNGTPLSSSYSDANITDLIDRKTFNDQVERLKQNIKNFVSRKTNPQPVKKLEKNIKNSLSQQDNIELEIDQILRNENPTFEQHLRSPSLAELAHSDTVFNPSLMTNSSKNNGTVLNSEKNFNDYWKSFKEDLEKNRMKEDLDDMGDGSVNEQDFLSESELFLEDMEKIERMSNDLSTVESRKTHLNKWDPNHSQRRNSISSLLSTGKTKRDRTPRKDLPMSPASSIDELAASFSRRSLTPSVSNPTNNNNNSVAKGNSDSSLDNAEFEKVVEEHEEDFENIQKVKLEHFKAQKNMLVSSDSEWTENEESQEYYYSDAHEEIKREKERLTTRVPEKKISPKKLINVHPSIPTQFKVTKFPPTKQLHDGYSSEPENKKPKKPFLPTPQPTTSNLDELRKKLSESFLDKSEISKNSIWNKPSVSQSFQEKKLGSLSKRMHPDELRKLIANVLSKEKQHIKTTIKQTTASKTSFSFSSLLDSIDNKKDFWNSSFIDDLYSKSSSSTFFSKLDEDEPVEEPVLQKPKPIVNRSKSAPKKLGNLTPQPQPKLTLKDVRKEYGIIPPKSVAKTSVSSTPSYRPPTSRPPSQLNNQPTRPILKQKEDFEASLNSSLSKRVRFSENFEQEFTIEPNLPQNRAPTATKSPRASTPGRITLSDAKNLTSGSSLKPVSSVVRQATPYRPRNPLPVPVSTSSSSSNVPSSKNPSTMDKKSTTTLRAPTPGKVQTQASQPKVENSTSSAPPTPNKTIYPQHFSELLKEKQPARIYKHEDSFDTAQKFINRIQLLKNFIDEKDKR